MECTAINMMGMQSNAQSRTMGQAVSGNGDMASFLDALLQNILDGNPDGMQYMSMDSQLAAMNEPVEDLELQDELLAHLQQWLISNPLTVEQMEKSQLATQQIFESSSLAKQVGEVIAGEAQAQTLPISSQEQPKTKLQQTMHQFTVPSGNEAEKLATVPTQNGAEKLVVMSSKDGAVKLPNDVATWFTQKSPDGQAEENLALQHKQTRDFAMVKEALRTQKKTQEGQHAVNAFDVDKWQHEANSPKLTKLDWIQQKNLTGEPEVKLLPQLTTGIQKHMQQGLQSFTMKLSPESLGEVTVTLTREEGKTVLDIVTGNAHASKIINEELAALREALRPMHVEVNRAQQNVQAHNQSEQQAMTGQSFSQQERSFRWQNTSSNSEENAREMLDEESEEEYSARPEILNAVYI